MNHVSRGEAGTVGSRPREELWILVSAKLCIYLEVEQCHQRL